MSNVPYLDYGLIDPLSRKVNISREGVSMSTETLPGVKYAFYLRGVELLKKGYIDRESIFSNARLSPEFIKQPFFINWVTKSIL